MILAHMLLQEASTSASAEILFKIFHLFVYRFLFLEVGVDFCNHLLIINRYKLIKERKIVQKTRIETGIFLSHYKD